MSPQDELDDDPCRDDGTSGERTFAFVMLFVVLLAGGGIAIHSETYFIRLLAAALAYTAGVMIYGFARNRNGVPRYLFTCPVVVSQYPRLLKRHAVFLAVETGFLAIALRYFFSSRSAASDGEKPNGLLVGIPLAVLALVEIFTNRGVLDRAHSDRYGDPASDESDLDGTVSLFGRDQ